MTKDRFKNITVNYENVAWVSFVIDTEILTKEKMEEINGFWAEADYRLMREEGNLFRVVVKLIARAVFIEQVSDGLNKRGVMKKFSCEEGGSGVEGFPSLDGSWGITLVDVTGVDFDIEDMTVEGG